MTEATKPTSYANAWLALLPQVHLPNMATQAVARECARYADWTTGQNVRPGRRLLGWNLNTSEATVKRALQACVEYGVLIQVGQGGVKGPKVVASVYRLSIPEHLATQENLAKFPDPRAVAVVRPKAVGRPADPSLNPDLDGPAPAPVGHRRPTEIPPSCQESGQDRGSSGSRVTHAVGHGRPAQWVIGDPPPSIDPPGNPPETTPTAPSRGPAAGAAPRDDETDQRRRQAATANGLKAVRDALQRARAEQQTSPP